MRYLGLDLGTKTLGISVSDKDNMMALPVKTICFPENDYRACLKELKSIIEEKNITELVLGLPKNMNNSIGFAGERSYKFKELLEEEFKLKVHLVDERLSTVEAEKILITSNNSRKKRKKVIDNVASSLILDTFLKGRRKEFEQKKEL